MALATATPKGVPSCRMVLLKGFSKEGFCFFTNYLSKKGTELANNPAASLLFYWDRLERQVRIDGKVTRTSREASEKYFKTRPRGAQIGAFVSEQSKIIKVREVLERAFSKAEERYKDQEIPCPEYWGGYILKPTRFEFWQGREDRLHDRIVYDLEEEKSWRIVRLAP